jgi:hypothetical protein
VKVTEESGSLQLKTASSFTNLNCDQPLRRMYKTRVTI